MENWQEHTGRYVDRVALLQDPLVSLRKALHPLPNAPLDFQPSRKGLICYQLCAAVIGSDRTAKELCSSIEDQWRLGRFLTVSISARLLIEIWGAVEFLRQEVLEKLEQTGNIDVAERKIAKFLHGSKSDIPLPWGGFSDEDPIHVMDMVRKSETAAPGALGDYEFLCDASHPCHLQHTYLMFAGQSHDNWSNRKFAEYGHQILERTLRTAERAIKGVAEAGIVIADTSIPVVLADRR
jgi:hypothetical protein